MPKRTTLNPLTNARRTTKSGSGGTIEASDVGYDNTLSALTSETVQNAIDELSDGVSSVDDSLIINGKHFYFDEHDGKLGFNTDESRGADTFSPFPRIAIGESVYRTSGSINVDIGFKPKYLSVITSQTEEFTTANGITTYNGDFKTTSIVAPGGTTVSAAAIPNTTAGRINDINDKGFTFTFSNTYRKCKYFAIG